MKTIQKYITISLMAIMLAVAIPAMSSTASAQARGYYGNDGRYYSYDQNYGYNQPTVYDRHRKAINIGVATGAGALIGALIGGRKGALIGAAAGVAGGYIVTKKQRPRNYTYYR